MNKKFQIVYSVLFFAVCALPLALMPFLQSSGEIEKKGLTEFPALIEDGEINLDFSVRAESWFNDRMPLRSQLLSAANLIKGELLHSATANVIVGKDGWLFYESEKEDYMDSNAMTPAQIDAVAVTLSLLEEHVTEAGGRFTFVPVPNKASVYGEYLPAVYRKAEENNLSRLSEKLDSLGVTYADMKKALTENRDQVIYHRRDSHWNNLGARIGFGAIMDSFGRPYRDYADAPFTVERTWRGDLDKLLYPAGGVMDDQYALEIDFSPFFFTYPVGVRDTAAQLEIFMSDKELNDGRISTRSGGQPANGQLYMIRDSFGRALLPFFIDSYAQATFVRTNRPDLSGVEPGTDVVYEIVERNLAQVAETAPYMFAPEREGTLPDGLPDGDGLFAAFQDEGYAFRLYGSFPAGTDPGDGRVRVYLKKDGESRCFEAFPIYESELLGPDGESGFSMFLDKAAGLSGEYEVVVTFGGKAFRAGTFQIGT